MTIENDYDRYIGEFEELLQKIATEITSSVLLERILPRDLWNKAEPSVMSLRGLAEKLTEIMYLLKPEKTPTIEKRFRELIQPLNAFKDLLFEKAEHPLTNSKLALEKLREAMEKGSDFLTLAKNIRNEPSKGIMEILKLKEVYGAKEYISTVPVPETIHLRFVGLKNELENLTFDLERALGEVRTHLSKIQEEIAKFRPSPSEVSKEKRGEPEESSEVSTPEPTLIRKDR